MAGDGANRRGQRAVAVLRSEADFTDPDLSRERRRLALYLLVHLADEHGRMSTAYQRVLKRADRDPGHWAHGRSLGAVRAEVTRWIGVGARPDCRPPWDRIADLVEAAVDAESLPEVLSTARYLHYRATGERPPEDAPLRCPAWMTAEHVTTSLIGGPEWARQHRLPGTSEPVVLKVAASATLEPEVVEPVVAEPVVAEPVVVEPVVVEPVVVEPVTAESVVAESGTPRARAQAPVPRQAGPKPKQPGRKRPVPDQAIPEQPKPEQANPEPPEEGFDPEQSAYELLWSVVRVYREAEERHLARIAELEAEVGALRAEHAHPGIPIPRGRTTSRHLALEDPSKAFTYRLPTELPPPSPATT